jgi:hypothetical protein
MTSVNAQVTQTISTNIKIEIKDSLLFINGDFVPKDSMVAYCKLHFGKPSRQSKGIRYKWHRYIYDDLGLSIMTHPNGNSLYIDYYRLIKVQPKKAFAGEVFINGHQIDLQYSFEQLQSLLYPCRFLNIHNRTLAGTFFTFDKGLGHDKLYEISYHFVSPELRISQPYVIKN